MQAANSGSLFLRLPFPSADSRCNTTLNPFKKFSYQIMKTVYGRFIMKLKDKVAVITGGTSGMALATAKLFVEEGAYVFITGRDKERLDRAVTEIGRNVTGVQGDAASLDDLDRLYDTVRKEKGKLDILFASAGRGDFGAGRPNQRCGRASFCPGASADCPGASDRRRRAASTLRREPPGGRRHAVGPLPEAGAGATTPQPTLAACPLPALPA